MVNNTALFEAFAKKLVNMSAEKIVETPGGYNKFYDINTKT